MKEKLAMVSAGIGISPQERGNRARNKFVGDLTAKGITLRRIGKKKFQTASGLNVGIPYASELSISSDIWFLGLADESFDVVVLLCETSSTEMLAFVLPRQLVQKVWSLLSRSHGQVKFHVVRAGSTYELRIPGRQLLPIGQYLNATEALR